MGHEPQNDLKSVLRRSLPTLAEDALGAAALFALLVAFLHLPGSF